MRCWNSVPLDTNNCGTYWDTLVLYDVVVYHNLVVRLIMNLCSYICCLPFCVDSFFSLGRGVGFGVEVVDKRDFLIKNGNMAGRRI